MEKLLEDHDEIVHIAMSSGLSSSCATAAMLADDYDGKVQDVYKRQEYAEVFDYSKITEKSGVITDYWTNNLLDLILRKDNLNNAYKQVKKNKGKGGIDGMQVDELLPFLRENQDTRKK